MTTRNLQSELAALDHGLDARGVLTTGDPYGLLVGPVELAYRREVEGQSSPIMCGECGYGLAPADARCPKCRSASREEATAFVRRDLSGLLEKHLGQQPARAQKRLKKRAESAQAVPTPREAARATGKPWSSPEYKQAYNRVYNQMVARAKKKAEKGAKP